MSTVIFGGTGTIGPHVAQALSAEGVDFSVLSRDGVHAREVLPPDIDVLVGSRPGQFRAVLDNAEAVLLLSEHGPAMQETQREILAEIRNPETVVVKISGTHAVIQPDGPDAGRQHWEVEQQLQLGPNPFVIIRPNGFMQTLVPSIAAAASTGSVPDPLDGARISLIDAADIGAVAARALVDRTLLGETLVLTGPAAVTYRDIVDALVLAGGPQAEVREVPASATGDAVRSRGGSEWAAHHLVEMMTIFRAGRSAYLTDDVERILGRTPASVNDFVLRNRETLIPSQRASVL